MARRMMIAGNWKMHGDRTSLAFFDHPELRAVRRDVEGLICPPATLLAPCVAAAGQGGLLIGGQDCHANSSGAHTGDVSAEMLADSGARYVIVGHSERRTDHGESDAGVKAKAEAVLRAGLTPIICVGETLEQREAGPTGAFKTVEAQLANSIPETSESIVIAYEPVWAIGTGKTASIQDIADMHAYIRASIDRGETRRILYGGSVKPGNASEILALDDVDGALVGGASLKADDFAAIIAAAPN